MRVVYLFWMLGCLSTAFAQESKLVWANSTGAGINAYYYFRYSFTIESKEDLEAGLHLYAFSRYALYVNGAYINFGPIRSYPAHPYYDTYDITSRLKEGRNVIAVQVMNNGIETFQLPKHTGSFMAWGGLSRNGRQIVSFETPGQWLYRVASGYLEHTPRFSFAKGPVEVYDARREPDNWKSEQIRPELWKTPVTLTETRSYGKMLPRTIPMLTQDETYAQYVINRFSLQQENLYNVHATSLDTLHRPGRTEKVTFQIKTWIYSPVRQEIVGGLSLGQYVLNGTPLNNGNQKSFFRTGFLFRLNQGWNLFEGEINELWSSVDFLLSFPPEAGIRLSHDKQLTNEETVLFGKTEQLSVQPARNTPANPAKITAWSVPGVKKEIPFYETNHITIEAGSDEAVVYDMGRMMLGRIFVETDAPAGTNIDVAFSEDVRDGIPTLYKRAQINAAIRFVSDGKQKRYETFKPYGARFLRVDVSNHSSGVILAGAGMVSQVYPFEKRGSFECSDPLMNKIWEMGWRSIQVCAEDSYTDTPFRERGHYAGDMFPQYAITAVTSGDTRLLKHTIRVINDLYEKVYKHEEDATLADYPLINLMVATWYIRQYNDMTFAKEIYPLFTQLMDGWWRRRHADGLFAPPRVFFEWIQIDKSAILSSFQALMVAGYHDLAYLCDLTGNPEAAVQYRGYANEIAALINRKMWNEEKKLYYDGIKDEQYLTSSYPNSSAYQMLWPVADAQKAGYCLSYLRKALADIGPPVNRQQLTSPYGGFYILAALYKYGDAATAEKFIRKHWGKMIYERDDTAWEDFNINDHSTLSHAWSASPTYFLSTQVLGVDLGFPQNAVSSDTVYIMPQAESIQWARGVVPHPKGDILVDWKISNDCLLFKYKVLGSFPVVIRPSGKLKSYRLIVEELSK